MRFLAAAFAVLLATPATGLGAWTPGLDPVTTYTNGMPLASSTPMRSHHVGWRCDPEHLGCCGGRYNWPCLNSALTPNHCGWCAPLVAPSPSHAATGDWSALEGANFETLGSVPAPELGATIGIPPSGVPRR